MSRSRTCSEVLAQLASRSAEPAEVRRMAASIIGRVASLEVADLEAPTLAPEGEELLDRIREESEERRRRVRQRLQDSACRLQSLRTRVSHAAHAAQAVRHAGARDEFNEISDLVEQSRQDVIAAIREVEK